ncbi:hypothetical protein GJA_3101 [Janthinobacterium agaricidamnosum NBRC 102515 = DSM 9628]|uniref:Uncharacterized protein n=1 Tax=Janthinobacterium agaricidamnosum NBRC 102515 = DSM 9628 TaxID=1349767 RepID=W0V8X6_9BURK|nr:hypothetical protein GJA_3101 [Janthinobacterium agaricidamnosum NBRC 102515 = DSM 9628]
MYYPADNLEIVKLQAKKYSTIKPPTGIRLISVRSRQVTR